MSITKTGFATLTNRLHAGENNSVFCRRDVCMSWSTCIQVSVEWWYTGAVVHVTLVITRCSVLPRLLSWFRFSSVPALSVANCVPSTGNRCLPSGKLVCW